MSKKDTEIDDDFALFRDAVQGVKKLRQDTIVQQPKKILSKKKSNVARVKPAIPSSISLTNSYRFSVKTDRLAMPAMTYLNMK